MGYTRRLKWFIAQIPEAANATLSLLTFFELFSGMRAWSRGMEMFDYHGQSADWKYQEFTEKTVKCDFLTPMGFLQVIASIMKMHARSIFLAGIPCSSWIFMSRWSTGGEAHPRASSYGLDTLPKRLGCKNGVCAYSLHQARHHVHRRTTVELHCVAAPKVAIP